MEQELRTMILKIKRDLTSGAISYDEAKEAAKPVIAEMNRRAEVVAKKFNRKPTKFTFGYVMR